MQEHKSDLARQSIELAVTGAAFQQLQQSEAMEQLLFHTRIFARFAPEQKVLSSKTVQDLPTSIRLEPASS